MSKILLKIISKIHLKNEYNLNGRNYEHISITLFLIKLERTIIIIIFYIIKVYYNNNNVSNIEFSIH